MKALVVGPAHFTRPAGAAAVSENFPEWQGQFFWVRALRRLGFETRIFRFTDSALTWPGRRLLAGRVGSCADVLGVNVDYNLRNARLRQAAEAFEPDVVFLTGGSNIVKAATMRAIRARGAKVALINGTSPKYFATRAERGLCREVDLIAVNDPAHANEWKSIFGARRALAIPVSGIDPEYHRPYQLTPAERREYSCDVAFVGSLPVGRNRYLKVYYEDRLDLLRKLAQSGVDLGLWSDSEALCTQDPILRPHYRGKARGEKLMKILCACKIALNHHGPTMPGGGNMRTFEIPACGALQFVDHCLEEWFADGVEAVKYHAVSDLLPKMRRLLEQEEERRAIAERGRIRCLKEHTYDERLTKILRSIGAI
ncbi:MAG: glycosyltransferase [Candidatus Sumerlaeota bacterium]|nr:glycosyltransferase [Candidatus Sumerlaeota bacterium]